jgi:methylthioribose-1-phosphate isomerase
VGPAAQLAEIWNPAFDVTPAELVTGYITDAGLLRREELGNLAGRPTPAA